MQIATMHGRSIPFATFRCDAELRTRSDQSGHSLPLPGVAHHARLTRQVAVVLRRPAARKEPRCIVCHRVSRPHSEFLPDALGLSGVPDTIAAAKRGQDRLAQRAPEQIPMIAAGQHSDLAV